MSSEAAEAIQRAQAVAAKLREEAKRKASRWDAANTSEANKKPKHFAVTKRIWIQSTKERSPAHFAMYLREHLPHLSAAQAQFTLAGRGSSLEPPPPGMPQQPLHVIVEGDTESAATHAEGLLEGLLQQARTAEVLAEDTEDLSQALTKTTTDSTTTTLTYKPASVAQLIGQAGISGETNWMDDTLQVPQSAVGFLIGRGGETISSIQIRTGAKMQIDKQGHGAMRTVQLSAPNEESMEKIKALIQGMVKDKIGNANLVLVNVPDAHVGLIIGKQGATIQQLQDSYHVHIQVPSTSSVDGMRQVQISGESMEHVQQCQAWMEQMVAEKALLGPEETVHIPVSSEKRDIY